MADFVDNASIQYPVMLLCQFEYRFSGRGSLWKGSCRSTLYFGGFPYGEVFKILQNMLLSI